VFGSSWQRTLRPALHGCSLFGRPRLSALELPPMQFPTARLPPILFCVSRVRLIRAAAGASLAVAAISSVSTFAAPHSDTASKSTKRAGAPYSTGRCLDRSDHREGQLADVSMVIERMRIKNSRGLFPKSFPLRRK